MTEQNGAERSSATDELRRMLDERGMEWWNQTDPEPQTATMARLGDQLIEYHENVNGTMGYHAWNMCDLTPEQAIAATLGRGECKKVYLVETSDDLIESWYPIGVYLNSKAAGDCAEALRGEVDGIRQFARVVELKVVTNG